MNITTKTLLRANKLSIPFISSENYSSAARQFPILMKSFAQLCRVNIIPAHGLAGATLDDCPGSGIRNQQ